MLKTILVFLAILLPSILSAENWPHWRGPNQDGTATNVNPPLNWSAHENVKWKVEVPGEGSATPIVWGNRVFVLSAVETDRIAKILPQPHPEDRTVPPRNLYEQFSASMPIRASNSGKKSPVRNNLPLVATKPTRSQPALPPPMDDDSTFHSARWDSIVTISMATNSGNVTSARCGPAAAGGKLRLLSCIRIH
jgi:hypothetical protein